MLTSAKVDQHYVTQMPRAQTPLAHTHARAASERWAMEECVKVRFIFYATKVLLFTFV